MACKSCSDVQDDLRAYLFVTMNYIKNLRKTRLNLRWRRKEAKKLKRMKSFTDGSSPPQVHRSAASDPEPAYRQRAIEWWEKNIQNTISGLGDDFATWRKVCLRIRLIRRNKLFGDWKMARPVCIRICWMLWLWPCKRHVVPSWTLTHEKLCRSRHFQIVPLSESRNYFNLDFW